MEENDAYKAALLEAAKLWKDAYPNEPFQIQLENGSWKNRKFVEFQSRCSYDIEAAIGRQRMFFYQVSLPHFGDDKFLAAGLRRYQMYLALKKLNPKRFLVPCYDNDLIWHSHQLHPIEYFNDTLSFLGEIFNHDDSVNDREPDSKLNRSDEATRELWKQAFNEEFTQPGAMFRGEPIREGDLFPISNDDALRACSKVANVTISSIKLSGNLQDMDSNSQLKVSLTKGNGQQISSFNNERRNGISVLKVKGPKNEWDDQVKGIARFKFDSQLFSGLNFELLWKKGCLCFESKAILGQHFLPLHKILDDHPGEAKLLHETFELENSELPTNRGGSPSRYSKNNPSGPASCIEEQAPVSLTFNATLDRPEIGPCVLCLVPSEFGSFTIPENVKQIWGPVPLKRLPQGVENKCIVATHKYV